MRQDPLGGETVSPLRVLVHGSTDGRCRYPARRGVYGLRGSKGASVVTAFEPEKDVSLRKARENVGG